jgi:hypothetical protein
MNSGEYLLCFKHSPYYPVSRRLPRKCKSFLTVSTFLGARLAELGMNGSLARVRKLAADLQVGMIRDDHALTSALKETAERVFEELSSREFRCLSREKMDFVNHVLNGLDPLIEMKFPSVPDELFAGGRCYVYNDNTACVFHLMRTVDLGLRCVAASLGITYTSQNWGGISREISAKMKMTPKTPAWIKQEPIYAEVLMDIQAISKAHRNPVIHEISKNYNDSEAGYILTVVGTFISHLAKHGFSE